MCGHLINVPKHFNVKLPPISGHLPNADADSHLLVVSSCHNEQCKQMPRFRWSFQPKIAGAHPNLRLVVRSNFRAIVQRARFYVIETNEPRACGKLVTFALRHHVVKVTYSVFQPAMSKKGTIFSSSLDQRIEMLRHLDETHRVEQGACWWASPRHKHWPDTLFRPPDQFGPVHFIFREAHGMVPSKQFCVWVVV